MKFNLQHPIDGITEVTVREPSLNDICDIAIVDVMQGKGAALRLLLPKITNLSPVQAESVKVADMSSFWKIIAGFFVPRG